MFNRQINRTANQYEVVYFFITFTVTVILPVTFITANQIVLQNITPMKNLIAQLGSLRVFLLAHRDISLSLSNEARVGVECQRMYNDIGA